MKAMGPRKFHAHVWNEPLIHEMTNPGERGVIPPRIEPEITEAVGTVNDLIPKGVRRKKRPDLPELSQAQVLRHYLRLSQQAMGMETIIDISSGTCTMKYSPKVNEKLAGLIAEVHPLQDVETLQGILEIVYEFGYRFLREVSGMDAFTFQPAGGSPAAYNNAAIIRKYHQVNGESEQRNEIITTIFSHPCDAACPSMAGFDIVTIQPDPETGLPDTEALKAAVSKHTAGMMITNPEDTGIFNKDIDEWTKIVHEVGGLCSYDQANANAIMGVTRAREAGFDLSFFNLHKTFSSPHGGYGPGCGGVGVVEKLEEFLPVPVVVHEDDMYKLDYDRPNSIGKVKDFFGNVQVVLRAYSWAMSMGARGLREAAEISMINNQYLQKLMNQVRGVSKYYSTEGRIDQVRWSLEDMKKETGVGITEFNNRLTDYGVLNIFTSHHPWIVPEPFTPEPCETYSKVDIEEWIGVLKHVSEEAYNDPELVKNAPHNAAIHKINSSRFNDPKTFATTWRGYLKNQR
jgi:glycine dehydrogenase subunit 2